jgi:hypothetical protein
MWYQNTQQTKEIRNRGHIASVGSIALPVTVAEATLAKQAGL